MSLMIALLAILFAGRLILKNYNPQAVLFLTGLAMMAIAVATGTPSFAKTSTGWVGFDIFEVITDAFKERGGGLGLQIMMIGGFAMYMSFIGASQVLVRIAAVPLARLGSPYLLLGLAFVLGQFLSLFIPSAVGLGLLLMTTLYPVLTRLGCSRAAAAAVLASTGAIAFGPASSSSLMAARTSELDISEYFLDVQLPVAIATIEVVTLLHVLVQRFFDKRDGGNQGEAKPDTSKVKHVETTAPVFYALLPMLPLIFMLSFSQRGVGTVLLSLNTSVLISMFICMVLEYVRLGDAKKVMAGLKTVFTSMGQIFATVITLIVAGETFAAGLKSIGAVTAMLDLASSAGSGSAVIVLLMALLTFLTAALIGSGSAAFFSFAPMVPDLARRIGANVADMILPIQLSASMGRTISPIASVIIAVSGIAGLSPIDVIKRTLIPILGGWGFMLTISLYRAC